MKQQIDYTEADRLYGAWLGIKGKINQIDYGQVEEEWPGQRADLCDQAEKLEDQYLLLTGELIALR